ncbi:MAG: hypothetical protein II635_01555 [Oscillospiraceae bacterium]|nr:hypothetical protein [Oscillospiraceae bacterium]
MAINLAKQASGKVAERFKLDSCTEGLFTSRYNWTGVASVQVYSIDNLPLQNYDATETSNSRFGNLTELGDTVQEMTVGDDKSFNGAIDKRNNTSQLMIKSASSVLKRETDEVIIPYVDKYRLTKLANGAGLVSSMTAASTKANIVENIFNAGALMSNKNVPKSQRVIFIGETTAVKLKLADQVVGIDKVGEKAIVNGVCGTVDGAQVRIVPDTYMPTGVEFMIVRKGVACAPQKIETYRILEEHPNIDGAVVQGRLLHDCFVLDAQANGIVVCGVATAANGGGYSYERVIDPTGNPYTSSWYTRSGAAFTAVPSSETTVDSTHTYYKRLT